MTSAAKGHGTAAKPASRREIASSSCAADPANESNANKIVMLRFQKAAPAETDAAANQYHRAYRRLMRKNFAVGLTARTALYTPPLPVIVALTSPYAPVTTEASCKT